MLAGSIPGCRDGVLLYSDVCGRALGMLCMLDALSAQNSNPSTLLVDTLAGAGADLEALFHYSCLLQLK